jgi:DNA polymerase gamma 1
MAEPWLCLAKEFAAPQDEPPAKPDQFARWPGWTKYNADGSFEHVDDLGSESALCFDVETLPRYSPFAVMACAVSSTAWYVWISPWLLGVSSSPEHLIPFGDPSHPRVIVGHHVSYDRARILEEYSLQGTKNRFLDTMALHIAVKGISSGQRPAWMSHRKIKRDAYNARREAVQAVKALIRDYESRQELDDEMLRHKQELEESLPELMSDGSGYLSNEDAGVKRWEDITSMNSLADLARLYCAVDLDKTTRGDFMALTREDILANIDRYLNYCADDVSTTFSIYRIVLPAFLDSCPNPVSAAGVFTMGSSFLTLDQEWENYIKSAESKYHELERGVRSSLLGLAEEALAMYQNDVDDKKPWETDEWLSQLDWTPKKVGRSRGANEPPLPKPETRPKWYVDATKKNPGPTVTNRTVPFLLGMSWHEESSDYHLFYSSKHGWLKGKAISERQYEPVVTIDDDDELAPFREDFWFVPLSNAPVRAILSRTRGGKWLENGNVVCEHEEMALRFCTGTAADSDWAALMVIAKEVLDRGPPTNHTNVAISQLNWTPIQTSKAAQPRDTSADVYWPRWYWELTAPRPDIEPGTVDLTVRSRVSPLLLRLSWLGHPLFHSRQHGWTYRVPRDKHDETGSPSQPLKFHDDADIKLNEMCEGEHFSFYKLPHKDGDKANVGSPMGKSFLKYSQDGTLSSPGNAAKAALDMNAQCSYWISARDRVMTQNVIWDRQAGASMGMPSLSSESEPPHKYGMILPQVITMGTVTRRAIERTWLTASNAKANRIGSELKTLVRAPEGYAIVGADVDSEELWIASVMGDAQFGIHGATAIGWMTLEGTKAAGTDLHSKTASILGISRNQAKVFNYSRIYGAGVNHAVLLLCQHSASMKHDTAKTLAKNLYASTKGKNTYSTNFFNTKFWHGGTESYLFNTLEAIALSEDPRTPALGCGVTSALLRKYLPKDTGEDYMTSRINWVVQSSGVDYLHMLIVAVDYLIETYNIDARYLISIHDEVRYLSKEEDKYRLALALQVANLWTRCTFAYKLGFDNLPQGVAFFSAVDVDKYLRKEVDMTCVTPSQLVPLPPGESLTIDEILAKTSGGILSADESSPNSSIKPKLIRPQKNYVKPNIMTHRQASEEFLQAQATVDPEEMQLLAQRSRAKAREIAAEADAELHAEAPARASAYSKPRPRATRRVVKKTS